jgi:hypothetical protein
VRAKGTRVNTALKIRIRASAVNDSGFVTSDGVLYKQSCVNTGEEIEERNSEGTQKTGGRVRKSENSQQPNMNRNGLTI